MKKKQNRDPILRTARTMNLLRQKKMTTAEIAKANGMTRFGAWDMMNVLASSHDVPVTCVGGYWFIVGVTPTEA